MIFEVVNADCLDHLRTLPANTADSFVQDPPYGLSFMGRGWDHAVPGPEFFVEQLRVAKPGAFLAAFGGTRTYHRLACAIEDAGWELRDCLSWIYGSGFPKSARVNRSPTFCQCAEAERSGECTGPVQSQGARTCTADPLVGDGPLPPGAEHLTHKAQGSLGGCLPGRDSSGAQPPPEPVPDPASPPSQAGAQAHSRSVALAGALDPEPVCNPSPVQHSARRASMDSQTPSADGGARPGTKGTHTSPAGMSGTAPRILGNSDSVALADYATGFPLCQLCGKPVADGFGTALKPSWEPIILARKPLIGTVAANYAAHGVGGLNIDACRIGWQSEADKEAGRPASFAKDHDGFGEAFAIADRSHRDPVAEQRTAGRWPANLILDPEAGAMLDEQTGDRVRGAGAARAGSAHPRANACDPSSYGIKSSTGNMHRFGDSGGASRFFYCAKSSRSEREAGLEHFEARTVSDGREAVNDTAYQRDATARRNTHPTVKPIALMAWLCKLITPPGGLVVDPFCGSGSTGCAAVQEGFRFLGIEQTPEHADIARARIAHWNGDPIGHEPQAPEPTQPPPPKNQMELFA